MGKNKQLFLFIIYLFMITFILIGCGDDQKKINVLGRVTYNGSGLAGVKVTLSGVGDQTTDAIGNYLIPLARDSMS